MGSGGRALLRFTGCSSFSRLSLGNNRGSSDANSLPADSAFKIRSCREANNAGVLRQTNIQEVNVLHPSRRASGVSRDKDGMLE
jgi:hypothetical protein